MLSLGLIPGVEVAQIFQNINDDGTEVRRIVREVSSLSRNPLLSIEEHALPESSLSMGVSSAVVLVVAVVITCLLEISRGKHVYFVILCR